MQEPASFARALPDAWLLFRYENWNDQNKAHIVESDKYLQDSCSQELKCTL